MHTFYAINFKRAKLVRLTDSITDGVLGIYSMILLFSNDLCND